MEKHSAACVMEWSIELEKALRSTKPGRSLEAISEMGPKLVRLSREAECSPVIYYMFDLISGEEKLFSNAIVLRLANAFESRDKNTRVCVLKAFLYEYRKRNKWKQYRGVLSKTEAHVQVEFLGRIKVVFDRGDAEDKALALGLFGCWAHFAKESPSIRYLVLSSMVSPHIVEVKASLFAAGCFAELSEDFARIVLEMLLHMMNSTETLLSIKLAGARMFAKIGFSQSIANNAYKTGVKLLLNCSDEDFQVVMLVSISKLASRSTILIPEHVDLLILFLNKERAFHLWGTALRCLHYILSTGMYHVNASLVDTIFNILDESQLPPSMLFQALQTLRKIILRMHPNLPFDVSECSKLLSIATNASPFRITSESMLAISVLVDISRKFKGSSQMESFVQSEAHLPSRVIFLIIDQITLMVKPVLDLCQVDSVVLQKVNFLLDLLIILSWEYPDLHLLVLDQLCGLIKSISIVHDVVMATTDTDAVVNDNADLKERSVMRFKLITRTYRFLVTFLENVSEAQAISIKVFDKVKILVEHLFHTNLFECYACTIYSLLLHHQFLWGHLMHETEGSNTLSGVSFFEHDIRVIELAKRMLTDKNSWPVYRVGTHAACQGAWDTATFIFEQLVGRVHSDVCCRWLKSLFHYAQGEWKCELLRWPKQGLETCNFPVSVSIDDLGEIGQDAACNIKGYISRKELAVAYTSLCSSLETLRVDASACQSFYFQRWFLSLRAKLLGAVVDMLDILRNMITHRQGQQISMVECLISLQKLTQVSLQLNRVAHEFDLVKTSFIDIDKKSSSIISSLAISCSMLAFCSGFALHIPSLAIHVTNCGPGVANSIDPILIQDLVGRLGHINQETIRDLCLLWEEGGKPFDCFHFRSRIQACDCCPEERGIVRVSRYVVSAFSGLKSKSKRVQNEGGLSEVTKCGLRLLLEILMKWMQIPSRTPKYFFNLRACLGSELFAVNETRNLHGICVSLGFHLSLNLCLQLRNPRPDIPARFDKSYCILYCKPSFLESRASGEHNEREPGTCQAWETDDMVEMTEKLLNYATKCRTKKSNKRGRNSDDGKFVKSFVCFELNYRGQGFSSCLLDVSGFPVGKYRIKWYTCCFDNQGQCWTLPPLNPGPVFTVDS